jgi:hypothetical protein
MERVHMAAPETALGSISGSLFGDNWFNILGASEPASPSKPRSAPPAKPISDVNGNLIDMSDLAPALPKSAPRSVDIGCGMGTDTKTVIVAGNFDGDTTRLNVVIEQSAIIANKAKGHNNHVKYVFLGNMVPDIHYSTNERSDDDSLMRAMDMKVNGLSNGSLSIPKEDVHLLSGARELGWLRIANQDPGSRELISAAEDSATDVLMRPSPFSESPAQTGPLWASWHNHDVSVQKVFSVFRPNMNEDKLRVLMFAKLSSIATLTMRAPGLVHVFLQRMIDNPAGRDDVTMRSLKDFLQTHDGSIEHAVAELFTRDADINIVGHSMAPACGYVVEDVIAYATSNVLPYMKSSSLVESVHNGYHVMEDGALWFMATGTSEGTAVSKIPTGVNDSTLEVVYKEGSKNRVDWKTQFNSAFSSFLYDFERGEMTESTFSMYKAYVAMSVYGGTTASKSHIPLMGLRSNPEASVRGVVANESSAFATIARRILVDPDRLHDSQSDVIGVLEEWSNINTDAFTPSTYFAVCSFCGQTQWDLMKMSTHPHIDLSEGLCKHLYAVSMTLAALLSSHVGDTMVSDFGIERLNGQLGPVVPPSHGSKQPLRAIFFSHEHVDTAFVAFVPEALIQYSLDYYMVDYGSHEYVRGAMLAVTGFLALPNDAAVPVAFDGLEQNTQEQLNRELAGRLWALKRKRSNGLLEPFNSDDYTATREMLSATEAYTNTSGHTIIRTTQTDKDPLCGLNIGVRPLPGISRVTIDTDCAPFHELFRVVARK